MFNAPKEQALAKVLADDEIPMITAKTAAQMLNMSARSITQAAQAGRLAFTRDGQRRLYTLREIRRYAAERSRTNAAA